MFLWNSLSKRFKEQKILTILSVFFWNDELSQYLYNILKVERQQIYSDEPFDFDDNIAKIRILRETGQKDQLIQSIRNDDIDTFQSIVTSNSIDIHEKCFKVTVFDGFE